MMEGTKIESKFHPGIMRVTMAWISARRFDLGVVNAIFELKKAFFFCTMYYLLGSLTKWIIVHYHTEFS